MTPDTAPTTQPVLAPITPKEGQSADLIRENIETLKRLMPEVVTEGKVDFDVLRQLLGDAEVLEEGEEKFGLNWHGKKRARQVALMPSVGTLRPCPEESVDWDTTQNLFIEGDNLEVLKLLQKSYANQVKMIYIDPPYNTGNEFIYPDRFDEGLETYLRYTGQKDENGQWTTSEQDRAGKKHTNWLNMMYPRLKLAKNLLRYDGVIFISCDDNEQTNLFKLCEEVFGTENFIAQAVWQKRDTPANDAKGFSVTHEYVMIFSKSDKFERNLIPRTDEQKSVYKNPDNDSRGPWTRSAMTRPGYSERDYYAVKNPIGKECFPPKGTSWRVSKATFERLLTDERVWWGRSGEGDMPFQKKFLSEVQDGVVPISWWDYKNFGSTRNAKTELRKLFEEPPFDYPKPNKLMKKIIQIGSSDNDLILDFFAGSGTTAHGLFEINIEQKESRKFILVQLPEKCPSDSVQFKNGMFSIADIGKERIRRAAAKLKEEHPDYQGDLGFKVFKLDSSNLKPWNPNPDDLEHALLNYRENILPNRSEEDVLYELLLKRGVDLASPIEKRTIAGKTVNSVGMGALFACLAESITSADVEELAQGIVDWHEEYKATLGDDVRLDTHVFFRDSAFADDVAKTNLAAILHQQGLKHVRSL